MDKLVLVLPKNLVFSPELMLTNIMDTKMTNLHICVESEVTTLVAYGKVALGKLGLRCVKGHLVTGQPSIVSEIEDNVNVT